MHTVTWKPKANVKLQRDKFKTVQITKYLEEQPVESGSVNNSPFNEFVHS